MPIKLAVTIDVEEEGLFSGNYLQTNDSVTNVKYLSVLDHVFREWDIKPTLLVTYQVARHLQYHDYLAMLKDKWKAEIGLHLHHWNTPPIRKLNHKQPIPSELMPKELLIAKLDSLIEAVNQAGFVSESFRMGRFNMGRQMFSILQQFGIKVDSSICPMHKYYGGPDHLPGPPDPYFPDSENILIPGHSDILEVPVTVEPLVSGLGNYFQIAADYKILPENWVSWIAQNMGCLPVQPMWTGLKRLISGAKLHFSRGGQVLTMFFHSSELMPGGCPQHQTKKDVERFLHKLDAFFLWLYKDNNVDSVTLSGLRRTYFETKMIA